MPLAQNVFDLLSALTRADVESLPPVERRRLADVLRHWAAVAEPDRKAEAPEGVLQALRYDRGHE
jgi:hypothetical protein